jgi:hypothetical protein
LCFGEFALAPSLHFLTSAVLFGSFVYLDFVDGRGFLRSHAGKSGGLVLFGILGGVLALVFQSALIVRGPDFTPVVNERWKVLDLIAEDAPIQRGKWDILIARPDCDACRTMISSFESRSLPNAERAAVIFIGRSKQQLRNVEFATSLTDGAAAQLATTSTPCWFKLENGDITSVVDCRSRNK